MFGSFATGERRRRRGGRGGWEKLRELHTHHLCCFAPLHCAGLYLPTSDVDAVIMGSGCTDVPQGLKALATALARKNMAKNMQARVQRPWPFCFAVKGAAPPWPHPPCKPALVPVRALLRLRVVANAKVRVIN